MKLSIKTTFVYFGILALVLAMGMSVWLLPKPIQKEEEQPITPPIDAKDEAGRYIQQASENFFYHEFDKAVNNYKKAIEAYEKEGDLKKQQRFLNPLATFINSAET
ncbi:MAG: hypothetical protein CM1200mP16_16470 [Nitrospina sp.]|nr:MAG: hypothetical protein CM1200mP16_16470 [Nitrospina sp.]